MSLMLTAPSHAPPPHCKSHQLKSHTSSPFYATFAFGLCKLPWGNHLVLNSIPSIFRTDMPTALKLCHRNKTGASCEPVDGQNSLDSDFMDTEPGDAEDPGSPWEGAVVYKRNPAISHVEYCTTLERLGLGKFSSEVSRSRASAMGLRVTRAVKDYPLGTPVQVSVEVIHKKKKLQLNGIVKTVLSLMCYRCAKPTPENVFSNFSLLLTEEPIEELESINMGVIYGEGRNKTSAGNHLQEEEEGDEEALIELDDRLHFSREEREMDISKNIRDLVHVEITLDIVCDPACKGMCLMCGTNLNFDSCSCHERHLKVKTRGPLGDLKEKMQQTK